MTAREFVELFYNDKTAYLDTCLDDDPRNIVSARIKELGLDDTQQTQLIEIIDSILTDVYYSILLGLDGCSTIGNYQYDYKIQGEDGTLITDGGKLEGHAWDYFHNK